MKKYLIIIITVCICCKNKDNRIINQTSLCKNEIQLLINPKNNWEIPIDSIQTMDQYRMRAKKQRNLHIENQHFPYSGVVPFIKIKDIEISLMELLIPVGTLYFTEKQDLLWIYYRNKKQYDSINYSPRIINFFTGFKQIKSDIPPKYRLYGPIINVSIYDNHFDKVTMIIKDIVRSYLFSINEISNREYHKNTCDLNSEELEIIKRRLPLNIKLVKNGFK